MLQKKKYYWEGNRNQIKQKLDGMDMGDLCFVLFLFFPFFLKKLNKVLIISQYTSNEFSCKAAVTEAEPFGSSLSA